MYPQATQHARAFIAILLVGSIAVAGCDNETATQDVESAAADTSGWVNLVEGDTVEGWKKLGGEANYRIEDGTVIGTSVPNSENTFLTTEKTYDDFILELETKVDTALNSGIQIRSQSTPDYRDGRVHGYQVEIDPSDRAWSGGIYDEARRGWLDDLSDNPEARAAFNNGEWNRYRIMAKGDSIKTWINGVPAARLRDTVDASGFIALQVHGTDKKRPMEVRWRNIRIKELNGNSSSSQQPME